MLAVGCRSGEVDVDCRIPLNSGVFVCGFTQMMIDVRCVIHYVLLNIDVGGGGYQFMQLY